MQDDHGIEIITPLEVEGWLVSVFYGTFLGTTQLVVAGDVNGLRATLTLTWRKRECKPSSKNHRRSGWNPPTMEAVLYAEEVVRGSSGSEEGKNNWFWTYLHRL